MTTRRKYLAGSLGAIGLVAALMTTVVANAAAASAAVTRQTSAAAVQSGALASISFDDGQLGQYQNAWPLLKKAGLHATFYVISDGMTWGPPQMDATEVKQLAAAGNEIGNHTRDHADLSTLTTPQVTAEFADSQAAFAKIGLKPTTCAYPYGAVTTAIEQIVAKYFTACRGTDTGFNTASTDRYDLQVFYLHSTTTVADIQSALQQAKADKSWIVFVHHGIGTGGTEDDISTAMFSSEVDAIKASGIAVETVAQAYASHH